MRKFQTGLILLSILLIFSACGSKPTERSITNNTRQDTSVAKGDIKNNTTNTIPEKTQTNIAQKEGSDTKEQPAVAAEQTAEPKVSNISGSEFAILKGKVICVDPGHQKKVDNSTEPLAPGSSIMKVKNPGGAAGRVTGVPEYVLNLNVSEMLKKELEKNGAKVVMTREANDVNLGNVKRAEIANEANADLYIRIHADSSDNTSIKGISVLIPSSKYIKDKNLLSESKTAGTDVLKELVGKTGAKSRGVVERDDMTGFNWAKVPMLLVEMGFMSNADEDKLMDTPEYRAKLVNGMVSGIADYFRI
ncbi:MAG: N-acetylmuramoyl-L-alanine amidase [Bacillota bacterium]|nr:N-acetylmuramoyl-L-alanine amidase [Bacillota bacterium]